jgi:hypothetical protein
VSFTPGKSIRTIAFSLPTDLSFEKSLTKECIGTGDHRVFLGSMETSPDVGEAARLRTVFETSFHEDASPNSASGRATRAFTAKWSSFKPKKKDRKRMNRKVQNDRAREPHPPPFVRNHDESRSGTGADAQEHIQ